MPRPEDPLEFYAALMESNANLKERMDGIASMIAIAKHEGTTEVPMPIKMLEMFVYTLNTARDLSTALVLENEGLKEELEKWKPKPPPAPPTRSLWPFE